MNEYQEDQEEPTEGNEDQEEPTEGNEDQEEPTEVSVENWSSRVGSSLVGIVFGVILVLASFVLLWWNEGRAVKTAQSLEEGGGAVVAVTADKVDPGNNGNLVHLSGLATTDETISDPVFNVSGKAVTLRRSVEMYQWRERKKEKKEKQLGGKEKTTTTYSYSKDWSSSLINSSNFKKQRGHENPTAMPYENQTFSARKVTLGAFTLPLDLAHKIGGVQKIPAADSHIPANLSSKAQIYSGMIYVGGNPSAPKVGDAKVSHEMVKPQTVSIIAKQSGSSFEPYQTSVGKNIYLLKTGTHSAESMFQAEVESNTFLTWVLRFVGFLVMFIGFKLIFGPLVVLADVVPIIGTFAGVGTSIVAFLLSGPLTLITIAIAWIFYRPLLGAILLAVAAIGIVAIKLLPKKA